VNRECTRIDTNKIVFEFAPLTSKSYHADRE
jgi:hypothetical protein